MAGRPLGYALSAGTLLFCWVALVSCQPSPGAKRAEAGSSDSPPGVLVPPPGEEADGKPFLAATRRKPPPECRGSGGYVCAEQRAYCPCSAPTPGSRCCPQGESCTSLCEASFFACRYDDCAADGMLREARCEHGAWIVKERPCKPCPASLHCSGDQLCVQWIERQVIAQRCVDDPCRGGPITCGCVGAVCANEPGAHCMESEIEGNVVDCLIPYSPGAPGQAD